jgi:hypothetical protein
LIELDMTAAGIIGIVANGLAPDLIKKFRRAAQKQALEEWTQRRGLPGLGSRFSGQSMGALGLSERSPAYVKRVIKKWGKYLPYTSPIRKSGYQHVRDRVRTDAGHRIMNKNKTDEIRTQLFLSGARVLNLLTGDKVKYRKQFLAIASRFGKADRDWIETRANELFLEAFNARIDSEAAKSLRARNRALRMFAPANAP